MQVLASAIVTTMAGTEHGGAGAARERLLSPGVRRDDDRHVRAHRLRGVRGDGGDHRDADRGARLDGESLYALTFAAPLACGVLGTVAAGTWSDRRGPALPLVVAMVLFSAGLLVCAAAPTMEVLLAGRVLQGLGGGALTVGLYVLVGIVFPPVLRPAVFASFAAAWVLPALFGPALAALVARRARLALGLRGRRRARRGRGPAHRAGAAVGRTARDAGRCGRRADAGAAPRGSLVWAAVAAVAVLALELLGSEPGTALPRRAGARPGGRLAAPAAAPRHPGRPPRAAVGDRHPRPAERVVLLRRGLHRLRPPGAVGTLPGPRRHRPDLRRHHVGGRQPGPGPAREPGLRRHRHAGRHRARAGRRRRAGPVRRAAPARPGRPARRTSWRVRAWASATRAPASRCWPSRRDRDRGFNSSALTIADSLGAALALSVSGVVFAASERAGRTRSSRSSCSAG